MYSATISVVTLTRMMKIAALAAVLLLSNCSTGFNRGWRLTLAEGRTASGPDITGAWQGTWRSEVNGHSGELRCMVSRQFAATCTFEEDSYRFHYHANFMKLFSATYAVKHQVRRTKSGFTFSGDQAIPGVGGGLYHYEGKVTPEDFRATYRCKSDHGVFELKRSPSL